MSTFGGFYSTGTIDVTNNSAAVVGHGVVWNDVVEGDWLYRGGVVGIIDSVNGTFDGITLKAPWAGATAAGSTYIIQKMSPLRYDPALVSLKVRDFIALVGTLVAQNANAVAITGGAIDGTAIGQTTAAAIKGLNVEVARQLLLSGFLSPAQITANQNDYNPANLANAGVLRLNTDVSRDLTGLAGGTAGRIVAITLTAGTLVLKKENAGSAAANRLAMAADVTLSADMCAILIYDAVTSRWRVFAFGLSSANIPDATTTGRSLLTATDAPTARAAIAAAPFDALAFNGMQVNGNVAVSQELGTTGAVLVSGVGQYIADLMTAAYVHGAGTAVVTAAQLAAAGFPVALPGYLFGHSLKATTALSAPANGDYARHTFVTEGYRVARLGWGAAGAQPMAYAFQFYSTVAGTAFVKFKNSNSTRLHYKEFAVAAGWQWIAGTLPGDTAGTWDKSNGTGLIVDIFVAGKAAAPVAPGAWTATDTVQTTNSTNLLGTNNNQTIVTGFIVLPGIELPASDRAPFIARPFDIERLLCLRYLWVFKPSTSPAAIATGGAFGASEALWVLDFKPPMRVTPSFSISAASDFTTTKGDGATATPTTISMVHATPDGAALDASGQGGVLTLGQMSYIKTANTNALLKFDARF
jgi:hypothetical protein